MKNFIQPGDVLTVIAPTGGVSSGDVIVVGAMIGVCATDAVQTAEVELALTGVYELPKAAGEINRGAAVWWDATTGAVVNASGAGFYPIGVAAQGAATGASTVRVRLSGIPVAAVGA